MNTAVTPKKRNKRTVIMPERFMHYADAQLADYQRFVRREFGTQSRKLKQIKKELERRREESL